MSKMSFSRQPFASQRVDGFQTLVNSARHEFYTTAPLIWDKLSWNMILLVISEMLWLFVNTLVANDKYSRHNRENFPQQIQMQLSQKRKTILDFSLNFWNLHQILSI